MIRNSGSLIVGRNIISVGHRRELSDITTLYHAVKYAYAYPAKVKELVEKARAKEEELIKKKEVEKELTREKESQLVKLRKLEKELAKKKELELIEKQLADEEKKKIEEQEFKRLEKEYWLDFDRRNKTRHRERVMEWVEEQKRSTRVKKK